MKEYLMGREILVLSLFLALFIAGCGETPPQYLRGEENDQTDETDDSSDSLHADTDPIVDSASDTQTYRDTLIPFDSLSNMGSDTSKDSNPSKDTESGNDTESNCGKHDDQDSDGACDDNDGCPDDPLKTAPGQCGCGADDLIGEGGTSFCLLAHWKFDGDALDDLGRFDGEEMGKVKYVQGPSGKAVDLTEGVGYQKSHIRVPSDAPDATTPGTLNPDTVSLAMWIQGTSDHGVVFERGRPCKNYYGCKLNDSLLTCQSNSNTDFCASQIDVSAPIDPTKWQHIVFTAERSQDRTHLRLRLYINGVLADSRVETGWFPNNTDDQRRYLVMGRNYMSFDGQDGDDYVAYVRPYYGYLDDVRVYGGALTSEQVAELFSSY